MEKEIQVCPLCKGKGTLPTGFYGNPGCSQGDVMQNKFPATCRVCFGKGVIEIEKEQKNEEPAHIDWKAWEPCESCISCENCKNNGDYDPYEGSYGECGQCYGFSNFEPSNFCRECGRPLTEEAQAELEKRLRG